MDTSRNPATTITNGKYQTNGGNYFAKFKETKGGLDFETLSKNNELMFADKGASFYTNTHQSFAAETFDKYDKREQGKLEIGDPAPNCKVQLLPTKATWSDADAKTEDDHCEKPEYKHIFDFCSNSKPMVLSFGSFS